MICSFGKKIGNVLNEKLSEGNYSINTLGYCGANISSQLYIIRLQIDKKVFFHKTITFNNKQNRKMAAASSKIHRCIGKKGSGHRYYCIFKTAR